jgi:hypothetical protein
MWAHRIKTTIQPNQPLTVGLPPDAPAGEAEVIVLVQEAETDEASQRESLVSLFRKLDATPPSGRTKEEIDRYLEEERASWER